MLDKNSKCKSVNYYTFRSKINLSTPVSKPSLAYHKTNSGLAMIKFILYSLLVLASVTGHAATIKLSSGDEIIAEIIENTDTHLRVQHSVLGELTIEKTQIISFNNNESIATEPQSEIANITSETKIESDNGLFDRGWVFPGFDRKFTLGISGKESNSSNVDIYTAFDADYDDGYKRWDVGFRSNYSNEDRSSTDNDFRLYVNRDWLDPISPWRYFAKAQYDWDQFKSWDYRLTGIVGPGYRLIKNERLELIGRTGLSLKKEYGSDDDDLEAELMLGFNSDWKLAKLQSVEFGTEFFSPFEDFGEIRNLSHLDWIYKLTDDDRQLSLKLSLDYEYDWNVDPGDKHDEFIYRTSLVWEL